MNCWSSSPTFRNLIIADNPAGGFYIDQGDPLIIDCVFRDNFSVSVHAFYSDVQIVNCLFHDNQGYSSGAVGLIGGNTQIVNCAFINNAADTGGGAVYLEGGVNAAIAGSIFRQNVPNQIHALYGTADVCYCLVQGGFDGEGNIDADPAFVAPEVDDYHLMPGSPCIDAGSNPALPGDVVSDLDGRPRFVDDPHTEDTGLGAPPVVDMGPLEFQADVTGLYVIPMSGFESTGPHGGPFEPAFKLYTLRNYSDAPLEFSVSNGEAWLEVDPDSGLIDARGEVQVAAYITGAANTLPRGAYDDVLQFVNETDHEGDTTRPVRLEVGVPAPIYSFPLDDDPGWAREGLWAFGQPTGGGGQYGGPDPTGGYSGPNVFGYNLDGDYENNLPPRHLISTPLDCSQLTQVQLKFRRWLGVEQPAYDHVYIYVSTDKVDWTQVWTNTEEIADEAWQLHECDISDWADHEPEVYVRWTMGPTDGAWRYCGWNIDDVEIWGVEPMPDCPADFDGDGDVDTADLLHLLGAWGTGDGDVDGDGDTDTADLLALLAAWGDCPSEKAETPKAES
ncbi:MAG: right-handed parallel beta-helix repeat-containing protein [Planctomycetota bacterium]|nr:right-handed parallel beta-helix repeat-containing protein [Planctomycetota bacterium]